MRVYLNNLREASKGIAIIRKIARYVPSTALRNFVCMGCILTAEVAIIKDVLGKECFVYASDGDWLCAEGGVGYVLARKYLLIIKEEVERFIKEEGSQCVFCKKLLELSPLLIPRSDVRFRYFPFSRFKKEPDRIPFSIGCLTCNYFTGLLAAEWVREIYGDDFFRCEAPYCIFHESCKVSHSYDRCSSVMEIEGVKRMDNILVNACRGKTPPEYIEMDGILKGIMEGGYLCEEHLKALREKLGMRR